MSGHRELENFRQRHSGLCRDLTAPVAAASAAARPYHHGSPRSRYAERGAALCVRASARNPPPCDARDGRIWTAAQARGNSMGLYPQTSQIKPDSPLRPSASSADGLFGTLSASGTWPFSPHSRTHAPCRESRRRRSGGHRTAGRFCFRLHRVTRMDSGHRPGARRSRPSCNMSKTNGHSCKAGSKRITLNASSRTWSGARRQETCASPPGSGSPSYPAR